MKHNHNIKVLVSMTLTLVILALGALAYTAIQNKKAQAGQEASPATTQTPHAEGNGHDPAEEAAEAGHGADDGHGHVQPGEGNEAHLDEVTLTPEAIQQNGIRVEAANKQAIGEILTVPGRVSYNMEQMAHVGTPVQGRVAELKVKLGDSVENGDELLIIDSPALGETQSDFLQKRTQVEVAASAVEVAKTAAERAKRLFDGKGISLGEYQRREGEYKFAMGTHKSAKSALTAAENTLHLYGVGQKEIDRLIATGEINPRYTVHAPISGQVIQREATLGEVVGPDREALLILADMKTLWVLADVPENQIRQVAINSQSKVTLDALGDQQFKGYVSYIALELNEETRTAQVRVVIEDGAAPISPGMFAQVHLVCEQTSDKEPVAMLAVPESAVQMYEGGPTVFVEVTGEPGAFAARPVKTGISNGKAVPILAGLDEGERVVVDGAFVIKAELVKGIMEGKTCSGH
jgi:membrane fusion protein, heavy metal efflux system